jgi:hypothetical protein
MTEKRKKGGWLDGFIDPRRHPDPPKHIDGVILTLALWQLKKKLKAIEPE